MKKFWFNIWLIIWFGLLAIAVLVWGYSFKQRSDSVEKIRSEKILLENQVSILELRLEDCKREKEYLQIDTLENGSIIQTNILFSDRDNLPLRFSAEKHQASEN